MKSYALYMFLVYVNYLIKIKQHCKSAININIAAEAIMEPSSQLHGMDWQSVN